MINTTYYFKDMTKNILFIYLFCIGLIACNDPYENTTFVNAEETPNGLYLSSHEEFSMWAEMLQYADLYNAINQSSNSFTVFAPTNEAVKEFLTTKGVSTVGELNTKLGKDYIQELAKYHLINKVIERKTFLLGGRLSYPTLSSDYLTLVIDETSTTGTTLFVNNSGITELAIETNNGLIYVLDKVMEPLTETLYDRLEDEQYSIFKKAVDMTGWNERLEKLYDTTYQEYGQWYVTQRKYTIFAVPDEVFNNNGIESVDQLALLVGAKNDYTSVDNTLNRYVAYHMVSSVYFGEDLFDFSVDSTLIWNTMASGGVITTKNVDGVEYLNYIQSDSAGVELLDRDQYTLAKNGVIHPVNGVLAEYTPEPVNVIWDFVNREEIATIINSWGASHGFGDCYQTYFPAGEAENTDIRLSAYEFDFWEYSSNFSNNNWSTVGYYLTKELTGRNGQGYGGNYFGQLNTGYVAGSGAYNDDFLIVNVGFMGALKIETPTILKGRYNITLRHGYENTMWDIASSGGSKVKFMMDDLPFEATLYLQSKIAEQTTATILTDVLWEGIEFPETGSHTFSLVVMDPQASTHSNYRLLLDYLKFEPVE